MKAGNDNFRESSVQGIMKRLRKKGVNVLVYEPSISMKTFFNAPVNNDLNQFKHSSDVIIANRWSSEINDVRSKVFSRDLFGSD